MKTRKKPPRKKRKNLARNVPPFPVEFRIKVARLFVEDDYPARLIAEQFGISQYSVYRWGRRYRQYGRQALVDQPKKQPGSKLPTAV
jgi:transposase